MRPTGMLVALAIPACLQAAPDDLRALRGQWELAPEVQDLVPDNCRSTRYEFDGELLTYRNGAYYAVLQYRVDGQAQGLSLRLTPLSQNGMPNCRGAHPSMMPGGRIANLDIDVVDDRLRIHLLGRGSGRHYDLVRRR